MSNDPTFSEHKRANVGSSKMMTGWILWTLRTREAKSMMTFFKALIFSRIKLCTNITVQGWRNNRVGKCANTQHSLYCLSKVRAIDIMHTLLWKADGRDIL